MCIYVLCNIYECVRRFPTDGFSVAARGIHAAGHYKRWKNGPPPPRPLTLMQLYRPKSGIVFYIYMACIVRNVYPHVYARKLLFFLFYSPPPSRFPRFTRASGEHNNNNTPFWRAARRGHLSCGPENSAPLLRAISDVTVYLQQPDLPVHNIRMHLPLCVI